MNANRGFNRIIGSALSIMLSISAVPVSAAEGVMCRHYFENTQRKMGSIKTYGQDLSNIAMEKLLRDLQGDTEHCIAECEADRFRYCNEVSKWISDY
jgi:hypothetical protein